jgi:hypothetical protein
MNCPCQQISGLGCSGNCDCPCNRAELGAVEMMRPHISFNTTRTYDNGKKAPDGIEIRFGNSRPTEQSRQQLKKHGYKFSEVQKMWYAKDSPLARKLVDFLEKNEIEVDTTQYQKRNFWSNVKSFQELLNLSNYTEFMLLGDKGEASTRYYKTKSKLLSANSQGTIKQEIVRYKLKFKKYYNVAIDEHTDSSNPDQEQESEQPEPQEKGNSELGIKLRVLAERMQPLIDKKLTPAIGEQRPTARRKRIAEGIISEGRQLQKTQSLLFALSKMHQNGGRNVYPHLSKISTKGEAESISRIVNYNSSISLTQILNSNRSELVKWGIQSETGLSQLKSEYSSLLNKYDQTSNEEKESRNRTDRLRKLENDLLGRKIPGFFPTPVSLIQQLIEQTGVNPGDTVLEPSAGKGDILDELKRQLGNRVSADAIEINPSLREILSEKGYTLIGADFLETPPAPKYDCVLMNPPFENGKDIDHFFHALKFLAPGSSIGAIMGEGSFSRSGKKEIRFREWREQHTDVWVSEPYENAFKDAFNQTGVRVRMVVWHSPQAPNKRKDYPDNSPNEPETELQIKARVRAMQLRLKLLKQKKDNNLSGTDFHVLDFH